jgi:hypothetical protein
MVLFVKVAPAIFTFSNTRLLPMFAPCKALPTSFTVITQDTGEGALYSVLTACEITTVAVPGPINVTRPVVEFTVNTDVSAGFASAYDFAPKLSLVAETTNGISETFFVNVAGRPVSAVVPLSTVSVHATSFCVENCEFAD